MNRSIYTSEQIKELKRLRYSGVQIKELSHIYGMSYYMITKYTRGVCRYKQRQVNIWLTEEDYKIYKELKENGMSARNAIVTMGMEKE